MKLHHKVNRPIQLLLIIVAIDIILRNDIGHAALLVIIVVAVWIGPTLRIKRKRTRKPTTKTP